MDHDMRCSNSAARKPAACVTVKGWSWPGAAQLESSDLVSRFRKVWKKYSCLTKWKTFEAFPESGLQVLCLRRLLGHCLERRIIFCGSTLQPSSADQLFGRNHPVVLCREPSITQSSIGRAPTATCFHFFLKGEESSKRASPAIQTLSIAKACRSQEVVQGLMVSEENGDCREGPEGHSHSWPWRWPWATCGGSLHRAPGQGLKEQAGVLSTATSLAQQKKQTLPKYT